MHATHQGRSALRWNRKTLLLSALFWACTIQILTTPVSADIDARSQMLLGNPDNAASGREHYLIRRPQYALSYNDSLRYPNWVSWHLNASDLGSLSRGQFQPDTSLPGGFTVISPGDYTRSGYDRGHNCPSADRTASRDDNNAVFLMSNMTPQTHGLNAGPWEKLEAYCRDLTKKGNELYIVCGHGFSAPTHQTIGRAKIAVPDFAWKVVVVVPEASGDDLRRINNSTRVIAIRIPNVNTVSREDWPRYVTTPAELERATGLKFFTGLPTSVADALRQSRDSSAKTSSGSGRRTAAPRPPRVKGGSSSAPTNASPSGQVWVNTKSGAYWRPGTKFYGKTKEGKYMSEAEALKAGYHPAGGR